MFDDQAMESEHEETEGRKKKKLRKVSFDIRAYRYTSPNLPFSFVGQFYCEVKVSQGDSGIRRL